MLTMCYRCSFGGVTVKFLLLAAMLVSTPAMAFNKDVTIDQFNESWYSCQAGENHDGDKISETAIKSACLDAVRLVAELKAEGYCLVKTSGEWIKCK